MKQHLFSVLLLAVGFLLLAPALLFVEYRWWHAPLIPMAREILGLSIFFFTFTLCELWIVGSLREKKAAYFVGANLGFSLLRLFCTVGIIFYFKLQEQMHFTLSFVNVLVCYFATLLFSTWLRHREDRLSKCSNNDASTSS